MSRRETQLAVLLRKAQWMLDDAAFEVGGGRFSSADREALAESLDELAGALREYQGERTNCVDAARPGLTGSAP